MKNGAPVIMGPVPMRVTKNSHAGSRAGKKAVFYTNLVCNPFRQAHDIMFSHGKMADQEYMNSAIYEFSNSEWEFLETASGELARLSRMSNVLPGFYGMISYPNKITGNFCGMNADYPAMLYSSVEHDPANQELRYRLSIYVALGGAIFSIFTHNCAYPLAMAICAVLFSRPYRQDWLDCPFNEIEDDVEHIANLFARHAKDFDFEIWNREIDAVYNYWHNFKLPDLIINCRVLRQMAGNRETAGSSAYAEPKPRLTFAGLPAWFLGNVDICEAARNISPLPSTAMALRINPLSGASVPMYPALDACDFPVLLVPESKAVWDAMIRIYGMKRHDDLYPESMSNQILLSPQGSHFAQEMTDKYNLVYLGLHSLGMYVDEIGRLEEAGANPDYQFHAFAMEKEGGAERRRR